MSVLGANFHGKDCVSVAKVRRLANGVHDFIELSVRIELQGGASESYRSGDNSFVVATDTCKNHVYMLAKTHPCGTPESFATDLALTFLAEYAHVSCATITATEVPWKRVSLAGSAHKHGFVKHMDGSRVATACATRVSGCASPSVAVTSTLTGLNVLKTTQSGWEKFHNDRFATLPDANDRILATTVKAAWTYVPSRKNPDYAAVFLRVREAVKGAFYGPPDSGSYSKGVQESLFKMGTAALAAAPELAKITLDLPNLHFLPANLPVFQKNDIKFEHDVYIPSPNPHGIICAVVERPAAKL